MDALLIIADSESCSDLYYVTNFLAPDPFIFLQIESETILIMSDLELDRAKSQATVDTVIASSDINKQMKESGTHLSGTIEIIFFYLKERGITSILVPSYFPIEYGDGLREKGIKTDYKKGSFFEQRKVKSSKEIAYIQAAVSVTDQVMEYAVGVIADSVIKGERLLYEDGFLTSEILRRKINIFLMERDCLARHTIVACGDDTCDPHNEGSGFLQPNKPIILDIFPRSVNSCYFADMTRTVVKGKPSQALARVYDTVKAAHEMACDTLKAGINSKEVHSKIQDQFEKAGFSTGVTDGKMEGFFHGTGHGVGLDIHESPRISNVDCIMVENNVVTVEPGLYYKKFGGVRLEDIVVITPDGVRNLNKFMKKLSV